MCNLFGRVMWLTRADEATLNAMFAEMERLNALIRQDQIEIDRLKAETDTIKLDTLRLKAESDASMARTLERLARLQETVSAWPER